MVDYFKGYLVIFLCFSFYVFSFLVSSFEFLCFLIYMEPIRTEPIAPIEPIDRWN